MKHMDRLQMIVWVLLLLGTNGWSKNVYVTPSGSGSRNGTDWANAWTGFNGITWSQINPGDVLYVAGGNYNGFAVRANGNAQSRVFIKRATAEDHGTEAGWQAGYNSQAVVSPSIYFEGGGNYTTIDGVVKDGIKVQFGDKENGLGFNRGTTGLTVRNLDIQGPGWHFNFSSAIRGIDMTPWSGASGTWKFEESRDILIEHCRVHDVETLIQLQNVIGITIQYCELYNSGKGGSSTVHPNMLYTQASGNGTVRYNKIYNIDVVNIFLTGGSHANHKDWYIHGNVFYDNYRGVEIRDGATYTNVFVFNNTMSNQRMSISGGGTGVNYQIRNNIFYNIYAGGPEADNYVYPAKKYTTATDDPIFVNSAGGDYRLKANSTARDIGVTLGSEYKNDMAGNTRGADGKWDMGAYEYTNSDVSWQKAVGGWQVPPFPNNIKMDAYYNILGQVIDKGSRQNSGLYINIPRDIGTGRIHEIVNIR